ncbi:MAG: sensor histidine kinase [Acidobacteria bacterium]|nr:sensor histidine kinase [Acidobacteriota bacterium]
MSDGTGPKPLPTLRKILLGRMSALMLGLGTLVMIVFTLGVREVNLLNAQRQAVVLAERGQNEFRRHLSKVEALGGLLGQLWTEGHFDPATDRLPDPVLAQAGGLQTLSGIMISLPNGRTSMLYRVGDFWRIQRLSPLGDGRSLNETEDMNPREGRSRGRQGHGELPWDARERPWFRQAEVSVGPSWTPVYPAMGGTPCITYTVPVRGAKGQFLGVVAMDYSLAALGELLKNSLPTPGSEALCVDGQGQVLAASVAPGRLPPMPGSTLARLPQPGLKAFSGAFKSLQERPGSEGSWVFRGEDDRLVVVLGAFMGPGATWTPMVSIPWTDLTPTPWGGVGVYLLVVLVMFGLGLWQLAKIASRVASPLTELARQAEQGSPEQVITPASGIREIQMLSESVRRGLEHVRERQQLREQLLRLERVQLAGALTSGIAHDLGNLLSAARLSLDLVEEEHGAGNPEAARFLKGAQQALSRGNELVASLLDFCRSVDSGRERFDLGALVQDLEPILRALLGKRNALELQAESVWVDGSPVQLEQVLVNLVLNARDAAGEPGTVRILVQGGEGEARLEVQDSGPGIPPEHLPRIFEPFFTTKGEGRGTGLGLAMARHIAEEHGGTLEAANLPRGGARFSLRVPSVSPPEGTAG